MRCAHWAGGFVLAAALGCEPSGEGSTGDGAAEDACQRDDYGTVMIELGRAPSAPPDPFTGTASVRVIVEYESCLADFYGTGHPELQQEGVEGAELFEAWADGCACDQSYPAPTVDCSVELIEQIINTQGAEDTLRLRVDYAVADDTLEGGQIPFGPLPAQALAGCAPLVRLSPGGVVGFDDDASMLWHGVTVDQATAKVGQQTPIHVDVE